jgi:hypothetical protein
MMRFDLLHDSSPHLRIGLVLPDIVHHLPDRSNHHIRTVDIYMVPAAAGDDATALRRQRLATYVHDVRSRCGSGESGECPLLAKTLSVKTEH